MLITPVNSAAASAHSSFDEVRSPGVQRSGAAGVHVLLGVARPVQVRGQAS